MSTQQVEKYKEIYWKKFGKEITNQQALTELIALVELIRVVHEHCQKYREDLFL
jgi:hypothetical protein